MFQILHSRKWEIRLIIQRAVDTQGAVLKDVGVDHGGFDIFVAEEYRNNLPANPRITLHPFAALHCVSCAICLPYCLALLDLPPLPVLSALFCFPFSSFLLPFLAPKE